MVHPSSTTERLLCGTADQRIETVGLGPFHRQAHVVARQFDREARAVVALAGLFGLGDVEWMMKAMVVFITVIICSSPALTPMASASVLVIFISRQSMFRS